MELLIQIRTGDETRGRSKSIAEKFGYKVKKMINIGFPLREVLTSEEEEDMSLIIIGSHGKSNLEEVFLGFRIRKGHQEM